MALVDKNGNPLPVHRIEKQKSWKRLWYVPLALPGLYLLVAPWTIGLTPGGQPGEPIQGPFDSGAAFMVMVLCTIIGLGFVAPGVLIGLAREGFDFTTDGTQMARWWGIAVPLRFTKADRAHYRQVIVEKEVKRGDQKGRHTWFKVMFGGDKGRTWIATYATYRPARQYAERVAKALKMPMRDEGGHEPFTRAHDELDVAVRDQPDRFGAVPSSEPRQPGGAAVHRAEIDGGVELRIPAPGLAGPRLWNFVSGIVAAIAIFLFIEMPFGETFAAWAAHETPWVAKIGAVVAWSPWVLAGAVLAVRVLPALWRSFGRDRLEVYRDRLRVHRFGPLMHRGVEMDAAEIEEITVAPRESDWNLEPKSREYVVSVRSDDGFVELGAGLSDLEREWLRDTLLHHLAG